MIINDRCYALLVLLQSRLLVKTVDYYAQLLVHRIVVKLVSCCSVAVSNSGSVPVGLKSPSPAGSESLFIQDGNKSCKSDHSTATIHHSLLVNSLTI